ASPATPAPRRARRSDGRAASSPPRRNATTPRQRPRAPRRRPSPPSPNLPNRQRFLRCDPTQQVGETGADVRSRRNRYAAARTRVERTAMVPLLYGIGTTAPGTPDDCDDISDGPVLPANAAATDSMSAEY